MLTVVRELVVKDHPTVGHRGAAVPERHLDAVVDLCSRHISGDGKHVDCQDVKTVIFSVGRRSEVSAKPCMASSNNKTYSSPPQSFCMFCFSIIFHVY